MPVPRSAADDAPAPPRRRHRRKVVLPAAMQRSGPRWRRTAGVLAGLAAFWILSDLAYYLLLPALGIPPSYNAAPAAISVFYLFWCGLAVIAFWPIYALWSQEAPWPTFRNRFAAAAIWTAMVALAVAYVRHVVPALPPPVWPAALGPMPDLVAATPAYFLPKTADIAFQQLLVLALVLALAAEGLALPAIAAACAALFGGAHVLLVFSGHPVEGVIRFTLFAAAFGAVLPWLILRVPFGLAAGFALHWLYYAVTLAQVRWFGPGAALRALGGGG